MRILAIESSTTSAKAMLYDSKDGVVGMLSESYSEGIEQGATGAQDPEAVSARRRSGPGGWRRIRRSTPVATGGTWHSSLPWTRRKRR